MKEHIKRLQKRKAAGRDGIINVMRGSVVLKVHGIA